MEADYEVKHVTLAMATVKMERQEGALIIIGTEYLSILICKKIYSFSLSAKNIEGKVTIISHKSCTMC